MKRRAGRLGAVTLVLTVCLVIAGWTAWDSARFAVADAITGRGHAYLDPGGALHAELANPDAGSLDLSTSGVGLATAFPTVTFEASNSSTPVAPVWLKVTLAPTLRGWRVTEMERVP